jgi:hypothetical protein
MVTQHGAPVTTISNRGPRFKFVTPEAISRIVTMYIKRVNTAYHPQTDGHNGRTIQTIEDMFRACTLDFEGIWNEYLS